MLSHSEVKPFTLVTNKPQLQLHSTGAAVIELQTLLAHWGTYRGEINGKFDRFVEAAVKRFQFAVFLADDGIVGSLTWKALETGAPVNVPVLRLGSTGNAVRTIQDVLKEAGFYYGQIDGVFGPVTEAAVRNLQHSFNLIQDGIVGPRTWWALSRIPRAYLPDGAGC
ncbi:peptidoglycan-binding protein [Ancylothrix sp. C2]|uniref:peptidoglycan-binding domain-containing protein n=1 Tax=Ancylothrix sp. D3o TaxID=2953691 RepID=UPI0021BADC21|nr:peptidoglycan-binding protein [Ancylothrix sp. D3o]MCT7950182.1 peptidoglycan-binding protein [Ancylothrix sp. D3o]